MKYALALGMLLLVLALSRTSSHASGLDDFPPTDVTIENTTGMSVDGVAVYMNHATNFDPLLVNAPGCEWPAFEYSGWPYGTIELHWPSQCVDPGESVELRFFSDCPGCEASFVGHSWLLQGFRIDDWEDMYWGDVNCSGDVAPADALVLLRYDAGVLVWADGLCYWPGQVMRLETGIDVQKGDVDCSGEITPVDALHILLLDARLIIQPVTDCPSVAETVSAVPNWE